MNSRTKLIVAGVIVLGALTFLIIGGFDSHSMHDADIKDIVSNPEDFQDKGIKVTGTVVDGTIMKTPLSANFKIKSNETDVVMKVVYKGVVPDTFQEDIDVILEGRYDEASKHFVASKLLTKCPSRYEGMDYKEHEKAIADKNA